MSNPLDSIDYPARCYYPGCGAGPFSDALQVDEHICSEHLTEAIWTFAHENIKAAYHSEATVARKRRL